jgi:glycosyltransferase A (GT-A) superfamily protein (DUF2064 family)
MKVLVMAKAPVAGAVKTRMCPPLHLSEAAELAAAALADTLQVVASSGADEQWIALDGHPGEWLPPGFTVIAQRGATFAERLENAWEHVGGPTLQIGMDTPQISTGLLQRSFAALEASPGAVLGHADDGGWWALGMLRAQPGVFRDIPMSTPATGERQADRLRELGLGPGLLPPLVDVDEWAHAVAVAGQVPGTQFGRCVAGLADRVAQRSLAQGTDAISRGGPGATAVEEP